MSGIVVTGDPAIDWLFWHIKRHNGDATNEHEHPNWMLHPGVRMAAQPGGALLMAYFMEQALKGPVSSPRLSRLEEISPETVIHSIAHLDEYPRSTTGKDGNATCMRVKSFCGYSGSYSAPADPLPIVDDDPAASLVVIDDAGNGFRHADAYWPQAITDEDASPIIILKMSRPLPVDTDHPLWRTLIDRHADRLIVVMNADDLRECGANISRRLSWEQTAEDFVWQMTSNPRFAELARCTNLIVRFGLEGAIHYTSAGDDSATFYYNPSLLEDGSSETIPGLMQGTTAAFVAALAARIHQKGVGDLVLGIRDGIACAERLMHLGFGPAGEQPAYPGDDLFRGRKHSSIAEVRIPPSPPSGFHRGQKWTILSEFTSRKLEDVSYATVVNGIDHLSAGVPIGRFEGFVTVDRNEIESYQSIKNLMQEYIHNKQPSRPLSIAVFGPPGSGKSFGVTQLAKSIAPELIEKIEFNISQFEGPGDLTAAFHKVRDAVLEGSVPLVFFDEFDAAYNERLGWLKYFLAPMQDGLFKDGEVMHPIGKAIFVFAGGTSRSFDHFSCEDENCEDYISTRFSEFRDVKGTDFVSRLRGYVNVMGPNPAGEHDHFYMIRRAILLRSLLQRNAGNIFDQNGKARIDEGVLRALIKVPEYKHGARSMEAVINMSMLEGKRYYEQASLPSSEQLKLHVDAEMFTRLVLQPVLFGDELENLARAIHTQYLNLMKAESPDHSPAIRPWEDLEENYRLSNRRQANQIPRKLQIIGYGLIPSLEDAPAPHHFTDEEVEKLAKHEHEFWMQEKLDGGWRYGKVRNDSEKLHDCLVPWDDLPEEEKEKDRDTAQNIPSTLAAAGFTIYPLR